MTGGEHPSGDSNGTGDGRGGRLSTQRDLWYREDRDGLTRSTRGPVPISPRHAVARSSLTSPPRPNYAALRPRFAAQTLDTERSRQDLGTYQEDGRGLELPDLSRTSMTTNTVYEHCGPEGLLFSRILGNRYFDACLAPAGETVLIRKCALSGSHDDYGIGRNQAALEPPKSGDSLGADGEVHEDRCPSNRRGGCPPGHCRMRKREHEDC